MISIKKSIGTMLKDENGLYEIAKIVASVIAMKLNIAVAIEQINGDSNYLLNFSKFKNELLVEKHNLI